MKKKKNISVAKVIVTDVICLILAIALIVGNYFAMTYQNLISVYLGSSGSDYEVSESEEELCRRLVEEGAVLVKNEDGALPLSSDEKKISLLGQNSVDFVYGGVGSGSVDASTAPTLKDSLEEAGFTVNETLWNFYSTGAGSSYRKSTPDSAGMGMFAVNEVPVSEFTDDVKSSMDGDDVGVVVIGRSGGESADIIVSPLESGYRYLQVDQDELDTLALACEKFDKVVLIVNASNPVELGFLEDEAYANVKAALWVGPVGQEGIRAIGKIMSGEVNPSGRLVDTYAYDSTSAPATTNLGRYSFTNSNVDRGTNYLVYQEGIYVGYRYYETRYEDVVLGQGNAGAYDYASTVQFPFGYGLSYTTFEYSDMNVEETENGFEVSVTVTNTGDVAGKDVVEVYMQSPYTDYDKENGVEKSAIELAGFAKTGDIEAGASESITVSVDKDVLKSYDAKGAGTYIVDEGTYYFTIGKDAHDALNNVLAAKGADSAAMTDEGNADLTYAYEQSELDTTTYATSAVTGVDIVNQFDDVDINYYYDGNAYVSRSDWEGTMPTGAYGGGSMEATAELLADLEFNRSDEVINDSNATMPTMDSTATEYQVTDLLGVELSDPKWDDLVSQLSIAQITRLVRLGGYSTISVDRIGLPSTVDKDGPAGISGTLVGGVSCMAWPAEVVMASTWNVDMVEEMGEMVGQESIDAEVAGWYAPGVDIHRSPYSGRNFEYYSEDGLLSGKLGAAEMRGVRSKGVIAYMKHFALNDQESSRTGGAYFANEQAIREIFLKGFELTTTEGGANACMVSMNRLGARWAGAHKGLMTHVLREEWGFEGVAITDQASVSAMFYQDMISGLWAGTDLWLNTNNDYWSLAEWADNPTVISNVQRSAKNIIYAVTNSNAVSVSTDEGAVEIKEVDNSMPTWKIALYVLDVVVWGACLIIIILVTGKYIRQKKQK